MARTRYGLTTLAWLFLFPGFLAGCLGALYSSQAGVPLTDEVLKKIQPGHTTFSDLLAEIGPPYFIIDGRKEIIDRFDLSPLKGVELPTRTLEAPAGRVILIYFADSYRGKVFMLGPVIRQKLDIRDNEVFIYLDKQDLTVTALVAGRGKGKRT